MSALLTFLGSTAFRYILGEVADFMTKRMDHTHELQRMEAQGKLDAAQAERNLAVIKMQADLGVKTIEVQAEADANKIGVGAWAEAVASVGKTVGVKFLDLWNGSVRPLLATLAVLVVVFEILKNGFNLSEWDRELIGAILGVYVADRSLVKRGK